MPHHQKKIVEPSCPYRDMIPKDQWHKPSQRTWQGALVALLFVAFHPLVVCVVLVLVLR